jgi:SAM-dependent methyltransferase
MQYDPIKDRAASLIGLFPGLRKCFYKILNLLLLRQRYVLREIAQYFEDGMKFYDAGAGFCQYSHYVLERYPQSRVFATDLKTDYLRSYALQAGPRFSFQSADLQDFVPQGSYDMAIAIDILEHIENDVQAIRNIHTALKQDGRLIISTPSDTDEAAKFTEEHVRPGYNKTELEDKLIRCGFEIETSIYSYGSFGALSWRLMMKYPLRIIAASKLGIALLPFWYLVMYPISELLMQLDLRQNNPSGTGILIVARKRIDR